MKKKNKGLTPPMSPCMYFHDCIALTITADFPIFTTKSYFKLIKYLLAHYLNNGDYESRREKKKSILEAPAVFRKSGGELCGL